MAVGLAAGAGICPLAAVMFQSCFTFVTPLLQQCKAEKSLYYLIFSLSARFLQQMKQEFPKKYKTPHIKFKPLRFTFCYRFCYMADVGILRDTKEFGPYRRPAIRAAASSRGPVQQPRTTQPAARIRWGRPIRQSASRTFASPERSRSFPGNQARLTTVSI